MAVFTKCLIDITNKKLIISATSSGITTDASTGVQKSHQFTDLYIDNQDTFICANEPSTGATHIALENTVVNGDLTDFEVLFTDILLKDIENSLLFVWLKEVEGTVDSQTGNFSKEDFAYYMGITFSVNLLYTLLLDTIDIKGEGCCEVDCTNVERMMAWMAFMLAKKLSDPKAMIKYWKILHQLGLNSTTGCSCNG